MYSYSGSIFSFDWPFVVEIFRLMNGNQKLLFCVLTCSWPPAQSHRKWSQMPSLIQPAFRSPGITTFVARQETREREHENRWTRKGVAKK